ncbi:hypothetical protein [Rhizobium sophoriradicis]|uniref:hypothetical protein n=1 Tax=Rhizobium sophoriradicis TaxID=1535245 RepID=UPI00117A9C5C|nr:hypothetical protein [Rhizobium sophoriradicis]
MAGIHRSRKREALLLSQLPGDGQRDSQMDATSIADETPAFPTSIGRVRTTTVFTVAFRGDWLMRRRNTCFAAAHTKSPRHVAIPFKRDYF